MDGIVRAVHRRLALYLQPLGQLLREAVDKVAEQLLHDLSREKDNRAVARRRRLLLLLLGQQRRRVRSVRRTLRLVGRARQREARGYVHGAYTLSDEM